MLGRLVIVATGKDLLSERVHRRHKRHHDTQLVLERVSST